MERKIPWWFKRTEEPERSTLRSDYTASASVSNGILQLLRMHMVPDVIGSREEIGLCTPDEHGDLVLGLCLYDIRENDEMRINGMISVDEMHQQYPPMYLNLYYMLTAYSSIDIRYREEENHRVLTRTMQVLHDFPLLDGTTLKPVKSSAQDTLHIQYQNLTMQEKLEIWQGRKQDCRLSLYYCVAPVRLDSTVTKKITRVKEIWT